MKEPCVLVVESDYDELRRISEWLDGTGYDVMLCLGPSEPDYICIASRGLACPLADAADVVVLDLRLRSDVAMTGTSGGELLRYYRERGKRVIAISGDGNAVQSLPDDQVSVVTRPLERESFVWALRSAARAL